MKVKRRGYADFETESVRIEIGENEFLLKEKADGLEIIEITDKSIELRPQVANSIVLLCKKGGKK